VAWKDVFVQENLLESVVKFLDVDRNCVVMVDNAHPMVFDVFVLMAGLEIAVISECVQEMEVTA
jgi:hypothetical protein